MSEWDAFVHCICFQAVSLVEAPTVSGNPIDVHYNGSIGGVWGIAAE
jgi:hypothetical protein